MSAKYKITSEEAYDTARYCLIDTLGCGFEALSYPACTKLLGPIVPGTIVPNGARVPGTSFQLDPVQAAFNIGAMIRWLDFNDTWLAAEWGHPSDNLGGILADGRLAVAQRRGRGQGAARNARRADRDDQGARDPGRPRAGEQLQPRRPRSRGAGEGRVDRRGREHAGPHAGRGHQRRVARVGRRAERCAPIATRRTPARARAGRRATRPRAPCASR